MRTAFAPGGIALPLGIGRVGDRRSARRAATVPGLALAVPMTTLPLWPLGGAAMGVRTPHGLDAAMAATALLGAIAIAIAIGIASRRERRAGSGAPCPG